MVKELVKYKQTGIKWMPEIPDHWNLVRLKSIVSSATNGVWGDEPKDNSDDITCIRVADIDEWNYGFSEENLTLRNIEPTDQNGRLLKQGDLIIEKSGGGDSSPVGRVVIFNLNQKAVTSNFMARLNVTTNISREFLYYFFTFLYRGRLNVPSIKATTGIQNLDLYSYLQNPIALPSNQEQETIVQYINAQSEKINVLVQKKQRFIALLKEQKQSIINHAVTKGTNTNVKMKPSGIDWLGEIPNNWVLKKCKNVFSEIDIRSENGKEELLSVSHYDGVNKRSSKNVTMFMAEDYSGYKLCWPGDLVINILWAWMGALGISNEHGIVSSAYGVYRLKQPELYNTEFLDLMLRHQGYITEYFKRSKGVNSSRARMYSDDFFTVPIITPPVDEQTEVVATFKQETRIINIAIDKAEKEIELMKEYREAMIAEAVMGKII